MPLRVGAFVVVAERHRGQRRAVERTVGQQDVLAERVDELGQSLGTRFDDFAGDDVAVDDDAAAFAESGRDSGLPGADTARQTDSQHADSLSVAGNDKRPGSN